MRSFENTFVRGSSPTYSDEVTSENAMSNTLPIGGDAQQYSENKFLAENFPAEPLQKKLKLTANQERGYLLFWAMIIVMLISTVGNLLLTLIIMGSLRLGKGMDGMELIPEEGFIKFYGNTDLDRIYTKGSSSSIEGFTDVPVDISSDEGSVHIRLHRNGQAFDRLIVDSSGIQFRSINNFEIKDPYSNENIFSTHKPHYNMPKGAKQLQAKLVSASRISSALDQPLTLEADSKLFIKGSEGVMVEGSNVLLEAENNILLNASNNSIFLQGGSGILLDMEKIPIVSPELGIRTGSVQYKICVCMPQGVLYRVPIPRIHNAPKITCAHFGADFSPCAMI